MAKTPPQLIDQATRHAVFLERTKTQYANEILELLADVEASVLGRLSRVDVTAFTRARLEKLIEAIRGVMNSGYDDIYTAWRQQIIDLANYEAGFEVRSLEKVVANFEFTLPTENQIVTAAFTVPLSVEGADKGKLLEPFFKDWQQKQIDRVNGAIRSGFAQGQTTSQIVAGLRDLDLPVNRRGMDAIVRTGLTHAATQARQATWGRNTDIVKGVRWVSTLDVRTSQICQSLSGNEYPIDKGPRPPAHVNACVEGTLITTSRGAVHIEHVRVGDMVLTHKGRWKKVYTVMCRPHDGKAIKLVNNFGTSVSLTHEHPVLTQGKGWIEAGDIEAGDVMFNNVEKLDWLDGVWEASSVPNAVLVDAHNIETSVTNELISYGIFSFSPGVSSSIKLNRSIANDEIGIVSKDSILGAVSTANTIKYTGEQPLVRSGVCSENFGHCISGFFSNSRHTRWVSIAHSCRTFFGNLFGNIWSLCHPMFVSRWPINMLLAVTNGLNSGFNRYSVLNAPFADSVVAQSIFPFDHSEALTISPVLNFNKSSDGVGIHDKVSNFYASSVKSIVEYHYSGNVYNLAVEDDETYLADGFVVHNCRSTTVAVLDERFKFFEDDATQFSRGPDGIEYVPANETYYSWLKRQPAAFQNEAIGPTRGKLLRDGGLSAERFAELQLGKRFEPLTLAEMKRLEPLAFQRANVDV